MDLAGFLANLGHHASDIDAGRRGLATDGREHEGRLFYEEVKGGALVVMPEKTDLM